MEEKEIKRDANLDATLKEIEKMFGKGSIMRLGDRPSLVEGAIPSGSMLLDNALGIGGYPKGRIIEIFGPESSGKTTLALHAIAEVQKLGGRAAFIDAEHAIDPVYAKALGVDIDELILSQPDYGEQALEIVDKLAESNAFDLIVVDSVAALVPKAELEGNMLDSTVGVQARLMSKALRKIAGQLNKSNCSVIFINQLREKVGVMYGNPETTAGGRALKFYGFSVFYLSGGDILSRISPCVRSNMSTSLSISTSLKMSLLIFAVSSTFSVIATNFCFVYSTLNSPSFTLTVNTYES